MFIAGGATTPKIPRLSSIDPASFYNGKLGNNSSMQRGRGRPPGAKNKVPPEAKAKSPKLGSKPQGTAPPPNTEVPKSPNKSSKNGPIYHNAHKLHLQQEKAKALAAATASMASTSATAVIRGIVLIFMLILKFQICRWASSNVVGIICPPSCNRAN